MKAVCSDRMVYLPFSFKGVSCAITIKEKDKENLSAKIQIPPIFNFEQALPKKDLAPVLKTLNGLCGE